MGIISTEEAVKELREYVMSEFPLSQLDNSQLHEKIKDLVAQRFAGQYMSIEQRLDIVEQIYSSIRGFGLLDSIMADDSITEVMVNGPNNIFIEQKGRVRKLEQTFESEKKLSDIIQRIVGMAGREVSQANPIVDTRLPDGSRVNVVLPPISLNGGAILTIRKFSKDPMTMEKLIGYGSITPEVANFLQTLVKARYNIFIAGGTGSGKTTFLNALSNYIPKDERIITIEDTLELQIPHEHVIRMETKPANVENKGELTMNDLVIVGEVRGAEALDMLQAMNTGHDGSLSTGHANSTKDMLSRLETMVLQGSEGLPLMAIRQQIGSAVDIIIHLSRLRDHSRKTMAISEILGLDERGEIIVNPLYEFKESPESTMDRVIGHLERTENPMKNDYKLRLAGYNVEI